MNRGNGVILNVQNRTILRRGGLENVCCFWGLGNLILTVPGLATHQREKIVHQYNNSEFCVLYFRKYYFVGSFTSFDFSPREKVFVAVGKFQLEILEKRDLSLVP